MWSKTDRRPDDRIRILSILGQKPEKTGSGILVRELWRCARDHGDAQRLLAAGYSDDDYSDPFDADCTIITYSDKDNQGDVPFPILGMSDAMPYPSMRFRDATVSHIERHIKAFQGAMENLITELEPDIVHIHHLWVLAALALSDHCRDIPCFLTIHGTDLRQATAAPQFRRYVERGIPAIHHFLSVSRDIMADARRIYGLPEDKISAIGNGYNDRTFRADGPVAECRDKVVLAAGKFVDWKGFHFLIRTCGRLETPHRLVIAGSGPEENRRALREEALRHNMQDRLLLPGHLSQAELAKWMRRADVFVLPSVYEPFGLVFLEALACGSPIIAADCGGAKDVVRERGLRAGHAATLIPPLRPGDPADEERYVSDLHRALTVHLAQTISRSDRSEISAAVRGLEWRNIYDLVRARYTQALSVRR